MPPMDRNVLGDRYTLVEVLGGAGMARVYLARDGVLGRDVALKVLRERYADDESFVERFRREAINAASLNHPSVVQVYDQGTRRTAPTSSPLKECIAQRGTLQPSEAASIASRVANALAAAHRRRIVRRDIKPHNVLLTASGEAKVADLSIARAAPRHGRSPRRT
jgi:eukaryotic-like serine/threonine-protein kinase